MRTVTFSSEDLTDLLNNDFVCAYVNIEGNSTSGISLAHAPHDAPGPVERGDGKKNVQTLVLTSDGKIIHAASGFLDEKQLYKELKFALSIHWSAAESPETATEVVVAAHTERLKKLGYQEQDLNKTNPTQWQVTQSRAQLVGDLQFVKSHPLMPIGEFLKNPVDLVGAEEAAFLSPGGNASGGMIGGPYGKANKRPFRPTEPSEVAAASDPIE